MQKSSLRHIGSRDDNTRSRSKDPQRRHHLKLTRNFGKRNCQLTRPESINASGRPSLTLDGDGRRPVELIRNLLKNGGAGAEAVVAHGPP